MRQNEELRPKKVSDGLVAGPRPSLSASLADGLDEGASVGSRQACGAFNDGGEVVFIAVKVGEGDFEGLGNGSCDGNLGLMDASLVAADPCAGGFFIQANHDA